MPAAAIIRPALSRLVLAGLSLAVAGCGTMDFPQSKGNSAFSINASAVSISTNGQVALHASLPSGDTAPVVWRIDSGTDAAALGQGHIDATGVYAAPGSISADEISV